jgi:hypothetical protein
VKTNQAVQPIDLSAALLQLSCACPNGIDGRLSGNGPLQRLHDRRHLGVVVAQTLALGNDDRPRIGRIGTPDRYADLIETGVSRQASDAEIGQNRLDARQGFARRDGPIGV